MACSPEERLRPHSSYDILRLKAGSFSKAFGEAASPTAGVGAGPADISAPSRPSPGAGQGRAGQLPRSPREAPPVRGPACPHSVRLGVLSVRPVWGRPPREVAEPCFRVFLHLGQAHDEGGTAWPGSGRSNSPRDRCHPPGATRPSTIASPSTHSFLRPKGRRTTNPWQRQSRVSLN